MSLLRVEYSSRELEMCTSFQVVLPDEGDLGKTKVVYLLHGISDNCTGWTRYTSCERYARERGVALVIPEVQRSFYADQVYGLKYFSYISRELPQACRRMFGFSPERQYNFVCGLSMGGYGALKCALTYPENYAGCGSFSGAVDLKALVSRPSGPLTERERTAIFGAGHKVGPENDLFSLAQRAVSPPPIYLSCGEEDSLYSLNNAFAQALSRLGLTHRYDHRPGDHTWDFWDRSLQDFFDYIQL